MGYISCKKGQAQKLSEHFNSTEFDCHGGGCCSITTVNETLVSYLEQIRIHFGVPITITSGYRCPTHNSKPSVGGATKSRHVQGDAADIVVKGVAPRVVAQYAESIGILGIGLYETAKDGHFVHIDTRAYKSFWYGQAQRSMTTFGSYSNNTGTAHPDTSTSNISDTILDFGDKGSAVKSLQKKLIRLQYSCGDYGADGSFGQMTLNAVKKFQSDVGLLVDGIVGYQTMTALDKAISELDASIKRKKVKITASVLNVRSGPGKTYPVISTVRKDATKTVIEEKDGWGKITSPEGWISDQYYEEIS